MASISVARLCDHRSSLFVGAPYIPPATSELSTGDIVKIEVDPDIFKIAQEEHGGWNDMMAEVGRMT